MAMTGSSAINQYAINKFGKQFGENGSFRLVTREEMLDETKNPKEAWEIILARSTLLFLKDFNASNKDEIIKKRADIIIKFDKIL